MATEGERAFRDKGGRQRTGRERAAVAQRYSTIRRRTGQ